MALFSLGEFPSSSGKTLRWKIECDALDADDWRCLAALAVDILPRFRKVDSPGGAGERFAGALRSYCVPVAETILLCDDVLTTGGSMERMREKRASSPYVLSYGGDRVVGVVAFARTQPEPWITALFTLACAR